MATSSRYKSLREAVNKSRHALLPARFDPTGNYKAADRVHYRSISFRIIVHAEIESYLEDRAQELLNAAWKHWKSTRTPSETVISLLAFSSVTTSRPPESLNTNSNKQSYHDAEAPLQKAYNAWISCLGSNHGIKESNVLSLLLPLGIHHAKLDTTLLADLSSYGSSRGEVAHKSIYKITNFADPKNEHTKAKQLIKDLEKIDKLIDSSIQRANKFATVL